MLLWWLPSYQVYISIESLTIMSLWLVTHLPFCAKLWVPCRQGLQLQSTLQISVNGITSMCQTLCWPQGTPPQVTWTRTTVDSGVIPSVHSPCLHSGLTSNTVCEWQSEQSCYCCTIFSHISWKFLWSCAWCVHRLSREKAPFASFHSEMPGLGQRHTHQAGLHSVRPNREWAGARALRVGGQESISSEATEVRKLRGQCLPLPSRVLSWKNIILNSLVWLKKTLKPWNIETTRLEVQLWTPEPKFQPCYCPPATCHLAGWLQAQTGPAE